MTSELGRSKTHLIHQVAALIESKIVSFSVTEEDFQELRSVPPSQRNDFLISMAQNPSCTKKMVIRERARLVKVPEGGRIDYSQETEKLPGDIYTNRERLRVVSPDGGPITITETTNPNRISYLAAEHAENVRPEGILAKIAVVPHWLAAFFPGIFRGSAAENEALTGNPRAPATAEQMASLKIAGEFDKNRQGAVQMITTRFENIDYSPPSTTAKEVYERRQREQIEPGGSLTVKVRPSGGSWWQKIGRRATETFSPNCPVEQNVIFEAAAAGLTVAEVIDSRNRSKEEEAGAGITFSLNGRKVSEEEWGRRRRVLSNQ